MKPAADRIDRQTPTVALSIRQPWAWCIVNGHKGIENRTWKTARRGPIYIHAGLAFDKAGYAWILANFPGIKLPKIGEFELGGIVGQASIVDCIESCDSPWFSGPYGFVLNDTWSLPFRPLKGKLSFFEVVPYAD